MTTYTDINAFLEHLSQGVEDGIYNKATFIQALSDAEWARLIEDLKGKDTAVKPRLASSFMSLGVLPGESGGRTFTYADMSTALKSRLDLVRFARDNIKDFAAVRH